MVVIRTYDTETEVSAVLDFQICSGAPFDLGWVGDKRLAEFGSP